MTGGGPSNILLVNFLRVWRILPEVQSQLQALQAPPSAQDERILERPPGETSTRRDSLGNEEEGCEESPLIHVQASLPTRMHEEVGRQELPKGEAWE